MSSFSSSKSFLFSRVRILKSPWDAEWLVVSVLVSGDIPICSPVLVFKGSNAFTMIGLIAESTLKLINNTRNKSFWNTILKTNVFT